MRFQVTIRYGGRSQRYHSDLVEAADARAALVEAARTMPDEVAVDANLVEVRVAVDPERREYVG